MWWLRPVGHSGAVSSYISQTRAAGRSGGSSGEIGLGQQRRRGLSERPGGCGEGNDPAGHGRLLGEVAANALASEASASAGHQGHSQQLIAVVAGNRPFPAALAGVAEDQPRIVPDMTVEDWLLLSMSTL
jgi:hypothetical protein